MVTSVIQTSFHAGEWAPALNARVDLAKYKAAAALLRNFFVDYRGGASTRTGTKYIVQAFKSNKTVRLIPFRASTTVGYILEFGDFYIRFIFNGAPVLEALDAITAATQANPCQLTIPTHGFVVGDWIFINNVGGMTQLNNRYFRVNSVIDANNITIGTIIDSANVNSTAYTAYTSGGTAGRLYTLPSPYAAADLALLKFTQSVNQMIICNANYPPNVLTLISANNWTIAPISFGTNITTPTGLAAATTNAGTWHYGYVVTAVDVNGQESAATSVVYSTVTNTAGVAATVNLTWNAVTGAQSYNVYRTPPRDTTDPAAGTVLGFIMNVTGIAASDGFQSGLSQNPADFSITIPIPENPFLPGVASVTVTAPGAYTTIPSVTIAAGTGAVATAFAVVGAGSPTVASSDTGNSVGQQFTTSGLYGNIIVQVLTVDGSGNVLTVSIVNPGAIAFPNAIPANPVSFSGPLDHHIQVNLTWGVTSVTMINNGNGYSSVPAVTFSSGAAAATAVLQVASGVNPTVPTVFQQRLVLAAPTSAVQSFNMSQPGSYYNFNISNPIQADDAISASIASGTLMSIKSMLPVPTGLIMLTDQANWLISSSAGAVSPINIESHAHSFNGASDVPPIVANFDVLFVQSKGSIVRDLTFNFYTQIYTGTDISVLSSHLFYGHTILEWAWAEEPFKLVHCVRDDGVMLMLTFLKEQDLIGWTHSDTTGGLFKSVATVPEVVNFGTVDAVYTVVQRTINGNAVKYIERFAERIFPNGVSDAWCVDAGLQYSGAPATNFSGAEHLANATVTGLADGIVIPPFTMSAAGTFTLGVAASKVTVGIAFLPQLKTLALDVGEPTVQGKRKAIGGVTVRVENTLGLTIGGDFSPTVVMKDLVIGNVGSGSNAVVTGLQTTDVRTIIDPSWNIFAQYVIQQPNPFPATILGVIPEIELGDTK